MSVQIALLRGINVGRAKRVAMEDLRAVLEGFGYTDVRTLLNSGNIVYASGDTPARAAARIEAGVAARTGVSAAVIVLTAKELGAAIDANPLGKMATDPSRLLLGFLARDADRARLAPLLEQKWADEAIALGPRCVYLWCPRGTIDGALSAAVNRALGDAITSRNWATATRLRAAADEIV